MDAPVDRTLYRFGPFALDAGRRRLTRDTSVVVLPDRHMDCLLPIVANAPRTVSREDLKEAAWGGRGVFVKANSIDKVMHGLRELLGTQPCGAPFIETKKRLGFRCAVPVDREKASPPPVTVDVLLAPYGRFINGLAMVESMSLAEIAGARRAFADALTLDADVVAAMVGLANTGFFIFESGRMDLAPDVALLREVDAYATRACELAPRWADGWCTLGLIAHRIGRPDQAIAAMYKAIHLEPDVWRHHLRFAFVSGGSLRMKSADRVLQLNRRLAVCYWFKATVFVACGDLAAAVDELRIGCALQDTQRRQGVSLEAVGLHLLYALVLAALYKGEGVCQAALDELDRELALENRDHVYGRECCANAWYVKGALYLRAGRCDEARAAFEQALARIAGHALATIGLAAATGQPLPTDVDFAQRVMHPIDLATARAAILTLQGRHDEAARVWEAAFQQIEHSASGWILPVEPLLHVQANPDAWARPLRLLRDRSL